MEKIKDFIKQHPAVDFILIIAIMVLFALLFGNYFYYIYPDRGREFLLPQEILNGAVPYKDITLIYFPMAYYINAIVYKLFGVSVNSLFISQTILCSAYLSVFYCLAKEFISRSSSLLLTLFITSCCIFSVTDLFSWIFPYSYARTYGCFGLLLCVFFIVKLFKTENTKYAYLAGLACGFSCSCKLEFFTSFLILLTGLFFCKRLKLLQYFKVLLSFLVFPATLFGIIYVQGVSLQNIIDSTIFALEFSKTPVMIEFLTKAGLYPFNIEKTLGFAAYALNLLGIIFLCLIGLKFKPSLPKNVFLISLVICLWMYDYNYHSHLYWILLPFFILGYCGIKFKSLWKSDKVFLFLLIAGLLSSQREFFRLSLDFYGIYSFPLLALSLCAILGKYEQKTFCGVNIKQLASLVLIVLIGLPIKTYIKRSGYTVPIKTDKGTFNADARVAYALQNTISYTEKNIDKNSTILVLPEGNIINFMADRKVDLHCFMMDRLYHDAYGEEEARDMIASTKSDYIILLKGAKDDGFGRLYLYKPENSLSGSYVWENYEKAAKYKDEYDIVVLKRKNSSAK